MKKVMLVTLTALLFASGSAYAGCGSNCGDQTQIGVDTISGSTSAVNQTFEAGKPSGAIGLSGLPITTPPQLNPLLQRPGELEIGPTLRITESFGEMTIGVGSISQFYTDDEVATTVFAATSAFKRGQGNPSLLATFFPKGDPLVTWLGVVMVTSKDGKVLLPPYDKQQATNSVAGVSNEQLSGVIFLPIENSRGITMGVKTEGSSFGFTSAFAKVVSVFLGVGGSAMSQEGTTKVAGTWSGQFLVFARDSNGVPLSHFVTKPTEPAKEKVADKVAEARQAGADAIAKFKMETVIEVPTQRVERERKSCTKQEFTNAKGDKVSMCPGSTSGFYTITRVIDDRATGKSVVTGQASTEKK